MVELDAHRCGAARQRERVQAVSGAVRHRGGGIHGRGPARFPYHGRRGIRGHCSGDFERSPVCRYHPLDGGRDGRAVAGRDAGASFFIDWLPIPAATDDMLLASVFGGLLGGWLRRFCARREHGRSDMLGKLIHQKFPHIRVGVLVCLIDGIVILGSMFIFDTKNALYALISVVIMNYMLDFALEGPDSGAGLLHHYG